MILQVTGERTWSALYDGAKQRLGLNINHA